MEFNSNTIIYSKDEKKIKDKLDEISQKPCVPQIDVECKVKVKQETLDSNKPDLVPCLGIGNIKDDIEIKEEPWWHYGKSSEEKEGDVEKFKTFEDTPTSESVSFQMECKNKIIIHTDDKTKLKEEIVNHDEISDESQNLLHITPNGTYFMKCDEKSEMGFKRETWVPNIECRDVFVPEGPSSCLDTGTSVEVYIKEEPWICDGATTDFIKQEKEGTSDQQEVSKDALALESSRLNAEVVHSDNSVFSSDVGRHGTSHEIVNGNNADHGNSKPTRDTNRFESEQNKGDKSTQRYQCEICEKCYAHKSSLKIHKLFHSGIKPYKCDICEMAFTQKSDLQRHALLHSGTKRYKCDVCEKCFTRKSGLQSHVLLHSGTSPFKCESCEKCFTQKSSLQKHSLLHSGTKPFSCDSCEKCFTWKSDLQGHRLIHLGKKQFKCDICEKRFTWKSALQRHKLLHSGRKLT